MSLTLDSSGSPRISTKGMVEMFSRVNKHDGMPAYIQIMNIIRKEIFMGRMKEGNQLPPVRELAEVFGVNTNTVMKALERLQHQGLVEAEHGVGYFIKESEIVKEDVLSIIRNVVTDLKKKEIDLEITKLLIEEVWRND